MNVISSLFDESDDIHLGSFGSTRFLSLYRSITKILENYSVLKIYFLHYLAKKASAVTSNERYKKICEYLSDSYVQALFIFLKETLDVINGLELFLQKQEPIGPLFFYRVTEFLATLIGRCCPAKFSQEICSGNLKILSKIGDCVDESPYLGSAETFLNELNRESDKNYLSQEGREFYITLLQNLIHYFHFDDEKIVALWKGMSALCIQKAKKDIPSSVKNFENILELLRESKFVKNDDNSLARDEFVKLLLDRDVESIISKEPQDGILQLDKFFMTVFKLKDNLGLPRYLLLPKYIMLFLCIQPHSADVERSFSVNNRILSNEANRMGSNLLNCRKRISCHLKNIGGCTNMVITDDLCELTATAYKIMLERVEKERKAKEGKEL